MELTKQDKKHIEDEVSRLAFRITVESQEYAKLYEKMYLLTLMRKLRDRLDIIELVAKNEMRMSETEQQNWENMEKAGEILIGIAVLIGCNLLVYEVWRVDGVTAAIAAVILLLFCVGLFLWFIGSWQRTMWKESDIHTCAINYASNFCSQKLLCWTPRQAELEFLLATAYAAGARQAIMVMKAEQTSGLSAAQE